MWTIPGRVLQIKREEAEFIPQQLEALFFGGGITLSQVTGITGLEAYTVQHWVKRGFLTSPVGKRYTLRQLCRILNINMLRGSMPIDRICRLLAYVNGQLDDHSDDIIGDAQLYFMFVSLAARAQQLSRPEACDRVLGEMLRDYREPYPGAKERVSNALKVMLTAYLAARMRASADSMLAQLEKEDRNPLENDENLRK